MTNDPCDLCDRQVSTSLKLTHETSGRQARLCERCLEMSVRLQADARNVASERALDAYAEAADGQVWRSQHVRYVMPSRLETELLAREPVGDNGLAEQVSAGGAVTEPVSSTHDEDGGRHPPNRSSAVDGPRNPKA